MKSVPANRRAKHTRSKSGCGVCRVRRVRCDQARPQCLRCSSTGRTCDGYPSPRLEPTQGSTAASTSARIRSKDALSSWTAIYEPAGIAETEQRLLTFYENSTSLELGGDFQDDFWGKMVLQISHRVPFIRYAIFALTHLHIVHCTKESPHPPNQAVDLASFEHHATYYYSKTIELLNHHINSNKWASLEETLLCCVLCIRFEWIAGNLMAALVHLRSSLNILRQWHAANLSNSPTATSFRSPGGYLIRTTISPIYMQLALEASMLAGEAGSVPLPPPPMEPVASQSFETLKDARDSLYDILGDEHLTDRRLGQQARGLSQSNQKASTLERFNQWSVSLTTLLDKADAGNCDPTPAILVLRIWHKIVRIMLENTRKNDECAFDCYGQEFSDAIELATTLHALKTATFSVDTSLNSALFYAAIKCREPTIRRRAIGLLVGSLRQDGLRDSSLAVRLASHIVEQEEMASGCIVRSESDVSRAARMSIKLSTWEERQDTEWSSS